MEFVYGIGTACEDVEEGKAGGGEEGFDVVVAGLAVGAGVGFVVEFDGDERAESARVAEDEIDGAVGAVLPGLAAGGVGEEEELAEGDLGEDVGARANDLTEDVEEIAFGVGDEEFVDDDFGGGRRFRGTAAEEICEESEKTTGGLVGHGRGSRREVVWLMLSGRGILGARVLERMLIGMGALMWRDGARRKRRFWLLDEPV